MDFTAPRPDFGGIPRTAFGKIAPHAEPPAPMKAKAAARRALMFKEAGALLDALPAPGEAIHCITSGRYDMAVLLVALINQHPTPCRRLTVSTLCYAKRNAVELLGLLESRKIGGLTLLASRFFRQHYPDLDSWLRDELRAFPASHYGTARCHAKVACLDFADAAIVLEGSANLRANGNLENILVCNDRDLLSWHVAWINKRVNDDAEETQREQGRDIAAD